MVFLSLRWNYSPLKEKAVPLPGGLFVMYLAAFFPRAEESRFVATVFDS